MYQENSQRKWQTTSVSNPPLENLKTFIQKRIRAIMAKEWWDFIVNVNTLNSDHASLLYSLANLCPSFNYFLQTRDKELQLIIKKRPVVKPRIFSGTEKLDTTPEPIVPKQLPLVTRRNSATELVKILNELYPNENTTRNKPRTYGPASKQKKPPGPAKKNVMPSLISGEVAKKSSPVHATVGRTPLLKRLLADESQKENAHISNIKKMPQLLSMPVLLEDEEMFPKAILSNTNYDLNQNRLNQSPRKIKKIIKVKKKRYVYSNSLTADSKHRLKYILEDETPELSLKLIKKYRIKKCTIDVVRLKNSVLKYYEDLRWRNCEKLRLSLEESSCSIPNEEEMKFSASEVTEQISNSNVQSANSSPIDQLPEKDENVKEPYVSNSVKENVSTVEKLDPKEIKNMYCHGGIVPLGKLLMSDRTGNNNKHFLSLKEKKMKEISNDASIFLKPKDVMPKTEKSDVETKHLNSNNTFPDLDKLHSFEAISLKEKKMEISSEVTIFSKPKDVILKTEKSDIENKNVNCNSTLPDLDRLNSFDSLTKETPTDAKKDDKPKDCNAKDVLDDSISSNDTDRESETVLEIPVEQIRKSPHLELENSIIPVPSIVKIDSLTDTENLDVNATSNVPESIGNNIVSDVDIPEPTVINSNRNVPGVSEISHNEAPIFNVEKHLDLNVMETLCEMSDEAELSKTVSEIEKRIGADDKSGTTSDSLVPTAIGNQSLEKLINDTLSNGTEELDDEPTPKRPRIEINLSQMKVVTGITKTVTEPDNNDERVCKMCKSSFESVESWNEHFENKVPKCTPNLQMTWDNPELSLLTD